MTGDAMTQSLDDELRDVLMLAYDYADGLDALEPLERTPAVDVEIRALQTIAALAEHGLEAGTVAAKKEALADIEDICASWQAEGWSRAFQQVKADHALGELKPPSDAKH